MNSSRAAQSQASGNMRHSMLAASTSTTRTMRFVITSPWRPTPEVPLLLNPLFGLKSLLVNKSIRGYPISSDVVDVVPAVHVGHFMEQA